MGNTLTVVFQEIQSQLHDKTITPLNLYFLMNMYISLVVTVGK